MKVLLNDGLNAAAESIFREAGIETDSKKRNQKDLVKQIGDFDGLIVRSATNVTRQVIEAGANKLLKIVGRAGIGYDNIDTVAATENGIVVKCAPWGNVNAAAELALALILDVSRNIPQAHYSLKNARWNKKKFEGSELNGKTLGIIGCGRIGKKLSELALGINMEIIGYDPIIHNNSRIKYVAKEDVLRRSDYISIHASGSDLIITEKEISMMKPTAYLINTSRGTMIDEEALFRALKERKIAGAAIDVYEEEPKAEGSTFMNRLMELDNVILTPHLVMPWF